MFRCLQNCCHNFNLLCFHVYYYYTTHSMPAPDLVHKEVFLQFCVIIITCLLLIVQNFVIACIVYTCVFSLNLNNLVEKDILSREVFDTTCSEFWILSTIKIQVEPVSQFYLKEYTDKVLSFFIWYINYETAANKPKNIHIMKLYFSYKYYKMTK